MHEKISNNKNATRGKMAEKEESVAKLLIK